METYKDTDAGQTDRISDGAERLEGGETLMYRTGAVLVTARKRDCGDFIVARSKNGTTNTETFDGADTAASKFDRHAFDSHD